MARSIEDALAEVAEAALKDTTWRGNYDLILEDIMKSELKKSIVAHVDEPEKALENLEVEVYSHNATSTGTLTKSGIQAVLKALGK